MRSDKLGYNAPIEVYDGKYYRYSDPEYSITNNQLDVDDYQLLNKAIKLINQYEGTNELQTVLKKLRKKLIVLI